MSQPAQNHSSNVRLLALATFSAALFLPMMGRGFIHDDFVHLHSVANQPLWYGLTHACGGPFYTPVAWLTFKVDWMLWGKDPFPFAAGNLLLHVTNTLLIYCLAQRLWRSSVAARWTALGFSLLFPANTWAVMWISTRAHLLATLFYIAALYATLWFSRTRQNKFVPAVAIVTFSALSIFSKESGVTIPAAIAVVILAERSSTNQRLISPATIRLFIALMAVLAIYGIIRAQSGAVPITTSGGLGYSYTLSPAVLGENLWRYWWRTYGLLTIVVAAIIAPRLISAQRPRFDSLTRSEVLLPAMLFLIMIAPFVFLRARSGIYSYLPGTSAALWLGAVARSLYKVSSERPYQWFPRNCPIILVAAVFASCTVGHSLKWRQLAEVNTSVLKQIAAQQPRVKPNTLVLLTYDETDHARRFPEGFAAWGFPYAIQLLYGETTVSGAIVRQGESYATDDKLTVIRFDYVVDKSALRVVKRAETSLFCEDDYTEREMESRQNPEGSFFITCLQTANPLGLSGRDVSTAARSAVRNAPSDPAMAPTGMPTGLKQGRQDQSILAGNFRMRIPRKPGLMLKNQGLFNDIFRWYSRKILA